MPISGVEDRHKRADRTGLLRADTRSDILAQSHQRRVTVCAGASRSTDKESTHIMRQAWRGIAGLLAVGALSAGGSVALADSGGHGGGNGNGNRGNSAATTVFTMTPADGPPEGVAFDKRSGRFFVSRTGTGAIFSGVLGTPALSPFIAGGAAGTAPLATGLKVRKGLLYVAGASTGQIRV